MIRLNLFSVVFPLLWICHASAEVFFVDVNSPNPTPPYAGWSTAATDIQTAVDAASAGDQILVNDGIYQTGGRVVYGSLTNRVVINKAVTVQSVNGPAATIIQGYQVPSSLNGDSAIRCVYLTNNAALIGFTLADGATRIIYVGTASTNEASGGGVWCENTSALVSNCVLNGNSATTLGAGAYSGTLVDCQIINNTNKNTSQNGGGGAAYGALSSCTISNNYTQTVGGGAFCCTLSNCVISGNMMSGAAYCTLVDCTLNSNSNRLTGGGGAFQSSLEHCQILNNSASTGGGAYQCELNDCIVSNNFAGAYGGGVYCLANSTNRCGQANQVIGNSSAFQGGGVYFISNGPFVVSNWGFGNWIFTSNSAVNDGGGLYSSRSAVLNHSMFVGNAAGGNGGGFCGLSGYMNVASNCLFLGNISVGGGGGAYWAALNNCSLTGNKSGSGGGLYGVATNCVFNSNVASTNGGGLNCSLIGNQTAVNCNLTNNSAGSDGGGAYNGTFINSIFCGNSAYTGGGVDNAVLNQCCVVSNQAALGGGGACDSSSGVSFTGCIVVGNFATNNGGGVYGVYLVTNCLIANNAANNNGGGVYGSGGFVRNCTISGNAAGSGGGINGGISYYCKLTGNTATNTGGGAFNSQIWNCLLVSNTAARGGGADSCTLNNSTVVYNSATNSGGGAFFSSGVASSCIIYDNSAPNGANSSANPPCSYCCIYPSPISGQNISNDPAFINPAAGNFRLQTNSPCINAGNSGGAGLPVDLDGRPRAVGTIDIGAYEFQGAGMGEFIAWLQQYGLATGGSADNQDPDHDGMSNFAEWKAGTNPTNSLSVLQLASPVFVNNPASPLISWQSVNGITYYLQRSSDLAAGFTSIQSNIVGQTGSTSYIDVTATNSGPYLYRVGVQ